MVAYQTAWLKYYYPVEFMAALMTSVIDNSTKVSEYIQVCRGMGIQVLPPDINCGDGPFTVDGGAIRYGMYAIKSVGRPVIDFIRQERQERGLQDTGGLYYPCQRERGQQAHHRKSDQGGSLDNLDGNRRQMTMIFPSILDNVNNEKKNSMAGQMTLFDIAGEDVKSEFRDVDAGCGGISQGDASDV